MLQQKEVNNLSGSSPGMPPILGYRVSGSYGAAPRGARTLAERLFPGQDPINRRIPWTGDVLRFVSLFGRWRTAIGGVTPHAGPDAPSLPAVYRIEELKVVGVELVRAFDITCDECTEAIPLRR
jgi:hypothetical protein